MLSLTVELLQALWRDDSRVSHVWTLPRPCVPFQAKYDTIQQQLEALSVMDELLSGSFKH